jgi:hypothetical protein
MCSLRTLGSASLPVVLRLNRDLRLAAGLEVSDAIVLICIRLPRRVHG